MAAENPAESLRGEATCPICLDYYTDPVITECGHNFCRSCITWTWEGRDTNFPCPQCRKTSKRKNLRTNRQLASVTEIAKKLSQCSVRQKGEHLCEEHEEKLKLFCEEEQRPICVICRESRDHRSHTVTPIEEAVQEYKNKIQMHLEPLRKELEDLLKLKSSEKRKAEEFMSQTEIKKQKVESDFEEIQQFLAEEKQILLSSLEEEENKILQRFVENLTRLEGQSSSIKLLISEIEEKIQRPAAELLKDVKDTLSRCQPPEFPKPEAVSTDLRLDFPLRYPQQLKKLTRSFGEWWMDRFRYAVPVTLDPETAHPELLLSEDGKSVREGGAGQSLPDSPRRFDTEPCVLGREGFTSGRHYWEVGVELQEGGICQLGVCRDSVRMKGEISPSPEEGYWGVGLWPGGKCWALTSPNTELPLSESPRAVGILLDYEGGEVSFYNAENKSHLYTFSHTSTGPLLPFFCTKQSPTHGQSRHKESEGQQSSRHRTKTGLGFGGLRSKRRRVDIKEPKVQDMKAGLQDIKDVRTGSRSISVVRNMDIRNIRAGLQTSQTTDEGILMRDKTKTSRRGDQKHQKT
ncbi:E3 ubiquitin-protein ligase TRIM39-like [Rhinatrema bivittatum]|uniref:E3 ubiquitin-protein ligase TRIM39-like n=1 Tax=Rhinatrema bivittatum TaxID=194408 RepID=UPI00112D68A0|nr:E3 ubiquitin-protein ligase TRIM39-like [Rhinatrema bivittatum]